MNLVAMNRTLASLALMGVAVGLILLILMAIPAGRDLLRREARGQVRVLLGSAWLASMIATGGSLYYSEIVGFIPCDLCWYQRIAMYPLVLVLGAGALTGDRKVWRYGLPLAMAGLTVAAYHVLIQFRPALHVVTCSAAAPCTLRYVSAYGFVSIPVMAGSGFILIAALVLAARLAGADDDLDPNGPPLAETER